MKPSSPDSYLCAQKYTHDFSTAASILLQIHIPARVSASDPSQDHQHSAALYKYRDLPGFA